MNGETRAVNIAVWGIDRSSRSQIGLRVAAVAAAVVVVAAVVGTPELNKFDEPSRGTYSGISTENVSAHPLCKLPLHIILPLVHSCMLQPSIGGLMSRFNYVAMLFSSSGQRSNTRTY